MSLFESDKPKHHNHGFAFICVFWIALNTPYPNASAQDKSTWDEVWHVVQQFNNAFATNDVDAYFSHVDSNITVLTPFNPYRVEGIRDDREEFEYSLHSGATRVNFWQPVQPKVQVFGNTAVVSFFVRGSIGPEGHAKTFYWKITDVLIKRESGWKVVHIHVSATQ